MFITNCIGFNSVQIRNAIKYAIDNRDEQKSIVNFEKIFGYKYDRYYFTNKIIIEETAANKKYFYNCLEWNYANQDRTCKA